MCGILFYLSSTHVNSDFKTGVERNLLRRGPDFHQHLAVKSTAVCNTDFEIFLNVFSSVLNHQGTEKDKYQPFISKQFVFLWNGECYKSTNKKIQSQLDNFVNDGYAIFNEIMEVDSKNEANIAEIFASIHGPFAFILIDLINSLVFCGRDRFGRRSLVGKFLNSNTPAFVALSSVNLDDDYFHMDSHESLMNIEIPSSGIFTFIFNDKLTFSPKMVFPWSEKDAFDLNKCGIFNNFLKSNPILKMQTLIRPTLFPVHEQFYNLLLRAVDIRLKKASSFCKICPSTCHDHSLYAVLFSGGLDSAVIAAMIDKLLPIEKSIDLLNVSFDHVSGNKLFKAKDSPDRLTGISCLNQLTSINPLRRWNFVKIDITLAEIEQIKQINQVHNYLLKPGYLTILDESLGLATWFASRGIGKLFPNHEEYSSPAKIIFTGIGADEQLGGYSRHRVKFNEGNSQALEDELLFDLSRIGTRNMARDDRVISDHGREGRFPFLDEDVVAFLHSIPLSSKMDLSLPAGQGDKRILRIIADQFLGLGTSINESIPAAWQPKRAMQFGSRIAKVEILNPQKLKGHEKFI